MSVFVAVDVPPEVRRQIRAALQPVQRAAPDLRYTAEASWHLTLAFLGRLPVPRSVEAVSEALAGAAAACAPFPVQLDGHAGTFGRRVLWAALEPSPALTDLAVTVRAATAAALAEQARGTAHEAEPPVTAERFSAQPLTAQPFSAHVTLARAPRRRRVPVAAADAYDGPGACWRVDALQLLSSAERGRDGRYTLLQRWPLAG